MSRGSDSGSFEIVDWGNLGWELAECEVGAFFGPGVIFFGIGEGETFFEFGFGEGCLV